MEVSAGGQAKVHCVASKINEHPLASAYSWRMTTYWRSSQGLWWRQNWVCPLVRHGKALFEILPGGDARRGMWPLREGVGIGAANDVSGNDKVDDA